MDPIGKNEEGVVENPGKVKMERKFQIKLKEILGEKFTAPDFTVKMGEKLQYRVGKVDTHFQTDLSIHNGDIPLVVIELKWGNPTTHELITYAAKAEKHKIFNPHLRYGIVLGNRRAIPPKMFYHEPFDFMLAMGCKTEGPNLTMIDGSDLTTMYQILERQLKIAESLLQFQGRTTTNVKAFEDQTTFIYILEGN